VRGRGYLRNTKDLEEIALKMQGGSPVLLRDLARVELGPEERRGIAELNGQGEVVSGIALQRDGHTQRLHRLRCRHSGARTRQTKPIILRPPSCRL
jgi:Cu/Ag efflux pump CusA